MKKRQFLGAAAVAAGATPFLAGATPGPARGPTLLTITGTIARSNRGPLDPALDPMMHKQQIHFSKAYTLDFTEIVRLPSFRIRPTLEDAKRHELRGPLLVDVVGLAGVAPGGGTRLVLRAVDGYTVEISTSQARERRLIVATHLDGQPMALGGLGPLWAVFDADRVPEIAAKPIAERFAGCPWALYHIEVQG